MKLVHTIQVLLLLAITLSACAAPVAPAAAPTAPSATAVPVSATTTYTDPFAYCAAVGTVDTPGPQYVGTKVPESVAQSLKKASGASSDAPLNIFEQGSNWRCMNGKVYGCFVGANIPCESKADTSKTPTTEEKDFCKANQNADVVPAVVTGRETVYEWRCTNGSPEVVRQVFNPDAQGFISEFWYPLSPS